MIQFLKENIDITNFSNFRTKAIARYVYEINNEEDVLRLKDLGRFCEDNDLGMVILGKGTNTLFAFNLFKGVIVKNNLIGWNYNNETKILETFSNEIISNISMKLEQEYGNHIWTRFIGLPGGVGGAIFGNAGCFGLEISGNFLNVKVYNLLTGQIEIINKVEMNFSYRNSFLKENCGKYFIISAKFDLSKIEEKYSTDKDIIKFRKQQQPKGLSCGSFFKNPNAENPAGKLIEEIGLKGHKIGGAYFSDIHANFLMSDGTATYNDLLDLIQLAQKKVKKEKGIDLITEVRIIKNGKS